jgi:hypothetical protein
MGWGLVFPQQWKKSEWILESTGPELTQPWTMDIEAYIRQWFGRKWNSINRVFGSGRSGGKIRPTSGAGHDWSNFETDK